MNKRNFNEELLLIFVALLGVLSTVILVVHASQNNEIEGEIEPMVYESIIETYEKEDHTTVIPPANVSLNETVEAEEIELEVIYPNGWSNEDSYLLAKIAMAEAEGESVETKVFIILTILNRVESDKFPDTIREVIFQNDNGIYQFTPIMDGRWYEVEPDEECWEALDIVSQLSYDVSNGALFFETCSGESWHSRNLDLICSLNNVRFYK
jgi:spore germination cell wall hydrolase CwlJ-like protein